jgi:hypothetical protein
LYDGPSHRKAVTKKKSEDNKSIDPDFEPEKPKSAEK